MTIFFVFPKRERLYFGVHYCTCDVVVARCEVYMAVICGITRGLMMHGAWSCEVMCEVMCEGGDCTPLLVLIQRPCSALNCQGTSKHCRRAIKEFILKDGAKSSVR